MCKIGKKNLRIYLVYWEMKKKYKNIFDGFPVAGMRRRNLMEKKKMLGSRNWMGYCLTGSRYNGIVS